MTCCHVTVDDTENHFGGFLKKKSSSAVTMETGRTRKEVIEEIVAKSKQHKVISGCGHRLDVFC